MVGPRWCWQRLGFIQRLRFVSFVAAGSSNSLPLLLQLRNENCQRLSTPRRLLIYYLPKLWLDFVDNQLLSRQATVFRILVWYRFCISESKWRTAHNRLLNPWQSRCRWCCWALRPLTDVDLGILFSGSSLKTTRLKLASSLTNCCRRQLFNQRHLLAFVCCWFSIWPLLVTSDLLQVFQTLWVALWFLPTVGVAEELPIWVAWFV